MNKQTENLISVMLEAVDENPECILPITKEYINKYKPLIYGLLHQFLEIYKDYSNNTEYQETVARIKRNSYEAYLNVGFTEDQALALMLNDNLQLFKNIKNSSNSAASSIKSKDPSKNN